MAPKAHPIHREVAPIRETCCPRIPASPTDSHATTSIGAMKTVKAL